MTLSSIFYTILTMSFMGSITALVILFFKKIFKKSISPNWHYFIWIILLVRLIIPYVPESSFSIFNFFNNYNQDTLRIQSPVIHDKNYNDINLGNISTEINLTNVAPIKTISIKEENIQDNSSTNSPTLNQFLNEGSINLLDMIRAQNNYLPFRYQVASEENNMGPYYILGLIWVVGVFVSGTYIVWLQVSYKLKIRNLHHCTNENILSNYYNCKSQMKIRKEIPLILDSHIKTPSLIGIFNPKILISPDYINLLSDNELRFVFMHELAHYKRKDISIRWILILLQVLHWFNPVLWFAFYKIRQDCETACDYYVLSCIKPHEYKEYGSTMIKMLDIFSGYNYIPGATGMLNRKKFIFERVRNIINFKKNYIVWSLFGVALFAVLTVFLLTNGKEPPKEVVKIKYSGEEISEELGINSTRNVQSISNNQLIVQDKENNQFIIMNNDGSKKRIIDCKGFSKDTKGIFTVDSKNNLYVLSVASTLKIDVYDLMGKKNGEIELKDADIAKTDYIYNWDLEVDSKGDIYILIPDNNIQVFNLNGSKIKTINRNGCVFIELDEKDNLYVGGYIKNDYIEKLNPLNDNILWKIEDNNKLVFMKYAAYSRHSKSLYVANSDKVVKIDSDGKSINPVLHIDSVVQNYKSFILQNITLDSNENIYFNGLNRTNYESLIYKINNKKYNISSKDIKTLTISVDYLNPTLEYAINKFENEYPDIVINVEDYNAVSWIKTNMTYEESIQAKNEGFQLKYDFIQKLNTQMLTGKSPDIIQIDSMPYKKYADMNMLLDFNELMENDPSFDKSPYYTNIFDAMEYNNKLYTIPLTVNYLAFMTNTAFLKEYSIEFDDNSWTWNDFLDISKEVMMDTNKDGKNDMYSLPTIVPQDIFNDLINSSIKNFVDYKNKKAYFTSKEFIELLKMCKAMSSKVLMNPEITESESQNGGFVFLPYSISDFPMFYGNWLLNTDEVSFYRYPTSNKEIYSFSPNNMYGISSNTKYQEEAWEFIKFLLSEEVQSYEKLFGIPINKSARQNKLEYEFKDAKGQMDKFGDLYGYNVTSPEKYLNQIKNNIEKLNEIAPKLNNCNTYDIQIQRILNEETKKFFDGNKSAEETSQLIQRKVEMYLNE
ncbi:extracellular solute-binding protein [Wukongibacter sp. M2B1]|uniref:extracellular solute-binding protein n=1 Tax=Wukongibacter sp. M2B1 TaxID=3088895 RepID=UPI003D792F93